MASIYDRIEPERRYRIGEAAKLAGVKSLHFAKMPGKVTSNSQ